MGAEGAPAAAPPAAAPAAPAAPVQKKSNALKFILFGCLGLLLLGAIGVIGTGWFVARKVKQAGFDPELMKENPALATAKIAIAVNPDLEFLSVDDRRGIIRVRQKSTGKTMELDFEKAKQGELVFREEGQGEVSISAQGGQVRVDTPKGSAVYGSTSQGPDWLPQYSGAQGQNSYSSTGDQGDHGAYTFKTTDSVEQVITFYERELGDKGYQVKRTASFTQGTTQMQRLTATGNERTLNLNIVSAAGDTTVAITW